jgi:hypothetical protein
VFVPLHRQRRPSAVGGQCGRPTRAGAVVAAVLGALATGLVAALLDKKHADAGDYVVLGLVIAIAAVGCGVAIAKAIGRQGKV